MKYEIKKTEAPDYRELLKFEINVFRVPFLHLMPKLYKDRKYCTENSRVIKSGGKIIGAYSHCPNTVYTTCGSLKAIGIASVAASRKHRNEGLMTAMMLHSEKEAIENGVDIGYLGGLRHRYERFGYIPCGEKFVYDVTDHFSKHNVRKEKYSFLPLGKCRAELQKAHSLFMSQPIHLERKKEDFELITKTWFNRCFVIFDSRSNFSGYLITDRFLKEINEIVLTDSSSLKDVTVSFLKEFSKDKISVIFMPWQKALIDEAAAFGEKFRVENACSMKFFSFRKPIEILLNNKLRTDILPEGTLVLRLGDETVRVTVKDKKCEAALSEEKPDITLSYREAVTALTSHYHNIDNALFKAWSPICEIAVPSSDKV